MLIIRNLNLISVQSWTYLQNHAGAISTLAFIPQVHHGQEVSHAVHLLITDGKVKSIYKPIVAHQAIAYPGFCSMKQLGVFLLPP